MIDRRPPLTQADLNRRLNKTFKVIRLKIQAKASVTR